MISEQLKEKNHAVKHLEVLECVGWIVVGGREGIRTLSDNMIHVGYKLDLMYTREFGNVWREIRIK